MVGSLLINFATQAQKDRFLPGIRSGDHVWCQGWSEASAGSDLANLNCKARRDGARYVVDGTKLWVSWAHRADWCMLLARTGSGESKQDGISILLVDMTTPGITVKPIVSLDGMHSLNEVQFENVSVPAENLVGEEGKGWPMMRGLVLDHERLSAAGVARARAFLERLYTIVRKPMADGSALIEHPSARRRLAWLEFRTRALHTLNLETLMSPRETWGTTPSVLKIKGTALQQDIIEMLSEAAGLYGIAFHPSQIREGWGAETPIGPEFATAVTPNFFYTRHLTISGGASEIHRNMIAKGALG
jgi:alkylation response protein AidB-like acyl-CoA dehydrogenase